MMHMAFLDRFAKKFQRPLRATKARVPPAMTSDSVRAPSDDASAQSERAGDTKDAYHLLRHPVISEKASRGAEARQYTFAVPAHATRIGVARAIASLYGVRPVRVNIIRVKGKRVRFGRVHGKQKDWKKAVVTVAAGKRLTVFEGV